MLDALQIGPSDRVVEFAPGLGVTARLALVPGPLSYTAVERDAAAAARVRKWLEASPSTGRERAVQTGLAQKTGLPNGRASVVYGEAMLSMQSDEAKREIVREAFRVLAPGGRYGIHELCIGPDDLPDARMETIRHSITEAIHHRAVPLPVREWVKLLESEGFEVFARAGAPMALLEPARLIKDEGTAGALLFVWRVLNDAPARARVLEMRRTFRRYRENMAAVCLVARKAGEPVLV
jgi:SAM-dependent methyltransferase